MSRITRVKMASLALAIAFSATAGAQSDSNREQMIDLVLQLQQLQDEVRMLRGQIEEQTFEIENIKRRQRDQYLDLDQRIGQMGAVAPVISGAVTQPAAEPPSEGGAFIPPAEDVPEVREERDVSSAVTGLAAPQAVARETVATPESEKQAYDRAFQLLKDLQYSDAAQEFSDFLVTHPNSEYADNAQYWLGESYYVTRNFAYALEAFETLISNYPDSSKIADGLLKIGYTHYELKNWEQARAALSQVKEQYPDSTLARLADSRLRSMRLEGHY